MPGESSLNGEKTVSENTKLTVIMESMSENTGIRRWSVVIAVIVSLICGIQSSYAQYASYTSMPARDDRDDVIYRKGANLYSDGAMLTMEETENALNAAGLQYADWEKAGTGFRTGKGLLIGFGSLTGAGLLTVGIGTVGMFIESTAFGVGVVFLAPLWALSGETPDMEFRSRFAGVATAGLLATGIGILGIASGTTVYCVYRKRLNRMADACNEACGIQSSPDVQLTFGVQRHGVGLALSF